MEILYEAIKARFDGDAALVTLVTELYTHEAPDPDEVGLPLCVLVPVEGSRIVRTFNGTEHWTERLAFETHATTLPVVRQIHDLIEPRFVDQETNVTPAGLTLLDISIIGDRFADTEFGQVGVQEFLFQYTKAGSR